jgi:N utilization substance protein A
LNITILEDEHRALVEVAEDQLSLAIGKGGQNVRLAAKLTGWRIDIKGQEGARTEQEPDAFEKSEGEIIHNSDALKEAIDNAVGNDEGVVNTDTVNDQVVAEEKE